MTHIVLTTDEHYAPFVPCLIRQIAQHGRSADGVIVVVPPGLPGEAGAIMQRAADGMGLPIDIRPSAEPPTAGGFAALGGKEYRSSFTNARLYLGETLPEVDTVLYLDIDLLVRDSLDELLAWELHSPVAAVREDTRQAERLFGDLRVPYYNTGVMLISLEHWRAHGVGLAASELLLAHPEWPHEDQDALNIVFRDRYEALPARFNVFNGRRQSSARADAAIVHFVGWNKPWFASATTSFADEWRLAQRAADPAWQSPSGAGRSANAEGRVADALFAARYSTAGRALRRLLPNGLKHRANSVVLAAGRRSQRLRRSVTSGLSSR